MHCQQIVNDRQTGGFQILPKLVWSNSWIAQIVRSEGATTEGAAADAKDLSHILLITGIRKSTSTTVLTPDEVNVERE